MANQAAWQAGWDLGGNKTKTKTKTPGKSAPGSPDVDSSAQDKGHSKKKLLVGLIQKGISSFKKGGRVKKTGLALLHKGEYVVPTKRGSGRGSRRKTGQKRSVLKP